MLKDITIGQHIEGNSAVHKMDARLKLVVTFAYAMVIFINSTATSLFIAAFLPVVGYALAKIPFRVIFKNLKPIAPIILFTFVLNSFLIEGEPLFTFWVLSVTVEGLTHAAILSIRIILLIVGSSLLTYTTSPIRLTAAIEDVLSPFKIFKAPIHELAMMMTIALRFIPTLIDETDKIMNAQKARGAYLGEGSIAKRIKALVPILVPLFVSAFRRADELAVAMECRCYNGGEGRTRLHEMKFKAKDRISAVVICLYLALLGFSGMVF